jgi:2-keto-3-deoxy-L-rhamnonate aldolase RhmA
LVVGIYSDNPGYAQKATQWGIQLIVVASDARLITSAAAQKIAAFKNSQSTEKKAGY